MNATKQVTDPTTRTPAEWREEAAKCYRRSADSWERSDTDGFLSQWASDVMAQRYNLLAKVAEDGGKAAMARLADAEGNVIEGARYVETRYGWSWVYDTPTGAVWFKESNHSNPEIARKRDLAKGHQVVYPMVPVLMGDDGHLFEKTAS